jgi:SAM-dependent methyltransferase
MFNPEAIHRAAYEQSQKPYHWEDQREFFSREGHDYVGRLPNYGIGCVLDVISGLIEQNQPGLVMITDLGCGPHGRAIKQCAERYRGSVKCAGINSNFIPQILDTNPDLVNFLTGDIQNADKILPDDSQDLVMSVKAISYTADPFKAVESVSKLLKPGGIALLDGIPLTSVMDNLDSEIQISRFVDRLSMQGIGVETYRTFHRGSQQTECKLSFKNSGKIPVFPVEKTGNIKHQMITLDFWSGEVYEFDSFEYHFTG